MCISQNIVCSLKFLSLSTIKYYRPCLNYTTQFICTYLLCIMYVFCRDIAMTNNDLPSVCNPLAIAFKVDEEQEPEKHYGPDDTKCPVDKSHRHPTQSPKCFYTRIGDYKDNRQSTCFDDISIGLDCDKSEKNSYLELNLKVRFEYSTHVASCLNIIMYI